MEGQGDKGRPAIVNLPPSANALFVEIAVPGEAEEPEWQPDPESIVRVPPGRTPGGRARRKRVKTKEYRAWINAEGWRVKVLEPIPARTPAIAEIFVNMTRKRDVDNVVKPLLDLLKAMHRIPDDRWVDEVRVKRTDFAWCPKGMAVVYLYRAP